jgi:hypothetical protein
MTIARVRTVFTGVSGAPWYSNLYFGTGAGDPEALASHNVTAAFWAQMDGSISNDVSYTVQGEVFMIDEVTGVIESVESVTPVSAAGAQATDMLPTLNQGLVTLRTGVYRYGRPVIGKIFIPGFTEAQNTDGRIDATTTATFQTYVNELVDGVPDSAELCVWSRPKVTGLLPVPTVRPGAASFVTAGVMNRDFAVLRSRRD